jgi:hypothetical protein
MDIAAPPVAGAVATEMAIKAAKIVRAKAIGELSGDKAKRSQLPMPGFVIAPGVDRR